MTSDTIVPCGPECRNALPLPDHPGEWIWCTRRGEPRAFGAAADECRSFSPRALVGGPLLEHTSLVSEEGLRD